MLKVTSVFSLDAFRQILQVLLFCGQEQEVEEGIGADGCVSQVLGGFQILLASETSVSGRDYYGKW